VRAVVAYPSRARGGSVGQPPRPPALPARCDGVAAKIGPFSRAPGPAQRTGRTHRVAGRVLSRQEGRG
jgi:hypothetical protein